MIKLAKSKDKDFVILNLSDPQLTEANWGLKEDAEPHVANVHKIFEYTVDNLIERVKPDLITITGDLAYPYDMRSYEKYVEYFNRFEIPWTVVWGNHDNQVDLGPIDEMVNILSRSKNFIFEAGPRELGSGNCNRH
ncbi:MAG: metallophosphoesterase [Clostridia bacterium]|nr:metallophosphoesterase [Clostridia bacterium]